MLRKNDTRFKKSYICFLRFIIIIVIHNNIGILGNKYSIHKIYFMHDNLKGKANMERHKYKKDAVQAKKKIVT